MRKKSDEKIIKGVFAILVALVLIGSAVVVKRAVGKGNNTIVETPQNAPQPRNVQEDYKAPASIEPKNLPQDLEATIGFEPKQLEKLTDHYALAKYEIGQDSIVYYYQTAEATNGERFMVICTQMSESDYQASIPAQNIETESYNGITLTYANRWLYSVPNDFEMIPPIQKGIDEGTMEIEYGNTLEEVIKKDCFYWYDGGIKYEIQVRNQNLPYETLFEIAKNIIDAKS